MANEGTYAYAAPMPDQLFVPAPPQIVPGLGPQIEQHPFTWHFEASRVLAALNKLQDDVTELVRMNKDMLRAAESILRAIGESDVKAGRVSEVPRKMLAPKRSKRRSAKKGASRG